MKYKIGLDIGIASVGWSTLLLDENDEPMRILDLGSRIFDVAENPKDGASLAAPRRENRGARRRLRRLRHRKQRIKQMLENNSIMSVEQINQIYSTSCELTDIYQIRYEAIFKKLSCEDFVRLLIHLAQRRGFKSNRKIEQNDKKSDAGKLTTAVNENAELMKKNNYKTIGQMLYSDEKFLDCKRNKYESYSNTFSRSLLEDEIKTIFEAQRSFESAYANKKVEEEYLKIWSSQRSFEDGPGSGKYSGNQIEKMLGKCTFEKNEFRAFKAQYSFEYFNLLQKVNSIKIMSSLGKISLTAEQREKIIKLAFKQKNVTYASIRKTLAMSDSETFNISYGNSTSAEVETKTKFTYLIAYHQFKKAFGNAFDLWEIDKRNALGYALTVYKNDSSIKAYLVEHNFSNEEIEIALTLPAFRKTANLSIKAIGKIIPFLEQGMIYNEACQAAGYDFRAIEKCNSFLLPANPNDAEELQDITNPVVRRAVSQTIKVVNSIIRKYQTSPCFIAIELARELSRNFTDRKKIEKSQKENFQNNQKIIDKLKSQFGIINPTGMDIVKLKLWEAQDGVCPYSLKPLELERLFHVGYVDVDHIIPYSTSFDDTYKNKVLVLASENRQKGNRLPLEYLSGVKRNNFIVWVNNNVKGQKAKHLLKEHITEEDINGFKKRNLQDTQYISKFILNYINKYLAFHSNDSDRKDTVIAVNGAATSYVRKRWGINKIREDGDLHHAVDAVVVACITKGMIKRISDYSKYRETQYVTPEGEILDLNKKTGELVNKFPMPYLWFRDELEIRCSNSPSELLQKNPLPNYAANEPINPVFVSRMPRRKVTGAAHKETVRSPKMLEDGYTLSKTPLNKLKLDKENEIENYYMPQSDTLLYNALKSRLILFGGNSEKAFAEPFYKPKSDGSKGPLVKKVKIFSKSTLNVPVLEDNGVADNGSMVRVDVFYVEKQGYYLVPIYVADTIKKELPNMAIVAAKSIDNWKQMEPENFIFSMYPNDLIKISSKKDMGFSLCNAESTLPNKYTTKEALVYFKSCDISTASIKVINHDNTYKIKSLGVKGLIFLEKYQVDVLGNISKVNKEIRQGFNR